MRIRIWPDPVSNTGPEFIPHLWYAWYPVPVKIRFYNNYGKYIGSRTHFVWREKVLRVRVGCDVFGYGWQYQLPEGSE